MGTPRQQHTEKPRKKDTKMQSQKRTKKLRQQRTKNLLPQSIQKRDGFAPVIGKKTRVLVLGSFPGVASLLKKQYYGHPQNQFWRITGSIIEEPLQDMSYDTRIRTLRKHGIGLWDVIASCARKGSLDASIREHAPCDFSSIGKKAPQLTLACFNGKKAGSFSHLLEDKGIKTAVLPSTSPAHQTITYAQKEAAWKKAILPVLKRRD